MSNKFKTIENTKSSDFLTSREKVSNLTKLKRKGISVITYIFALLNLGIAIFLLSYTDLASILEVGNFIYYSVASLYGLVSLAGLIRFFERKA